MFERLGELFEIPVLQAQGAAQLAPAAHGALDFPQDFPRPPGRDPEIGGDRQERLDGGFRATLLGDPRFQFPDPIRKTILMIVQNTG